MRRRTVRASLLTFAARGLAAGAAFLMHMLIARVLGAAGTGLFFLSLAVLRGALVFGVFGLNQSVIRFSAPLVSEGARAAAGRMMGSAGTIALAFGLAAAGIVSLASVFVLPALFPARAELWDLTAIFVWGAVPLALLMVGAGAVQSFSRPALASLLEVAAAPLMVSAALAALALAGAVSSQGVAWLYMAAVALSAGIAWAAARTWLKAPIAPRRHEAGLLLRASHPLLVAAIMRWIIQNAPLLILGLVAALAEAGVFSVAHRLAMTLSILLAAVNNVMFARFAVAWKQDRRDQLEAELHLGALMLIAAGAPVILALAVFRSEILALLGPEFVGGGPFLLILLAGQAVNLLTASSGAVLSMTGHERALRRNGLLSGAACLALSALLIPTFGGIGAAIALSAAMALQSVQAAWQAWRLVGVRPLPRPRLPRRR